MGSIAGQRWSNGIQYHKTSTDLDILIQEYNSQVLPLAKIRKTLKLAFLPRTELFKLKKNELR